MLLMAQSCTASGDGTLEAHGSCGGRVTGAEWQERCWIWRGRAAVIQLQEGLDRRWEVGSCGWLFYSGLFGFWGCSGVYGGCTVGALIWLKTKLSFQVKWSLSWLEGFGLLSGLWWFEGYFWVCFVLTVLGSWQCSSPSPASWGQGFWTILLIIGQRRSI